MTNDEIDAEYRKRFRAMVATGHIDINALDALEDWRARCASADLQADVDREREASGDVQYYGVKP